MKLGQNVFLDEILDKFKMFDFMKSQTSSKIGNVGSKTGSLGQILKKTCVPCSGHIFGSMLIKLGKDVCLNKISDVFENGSCGLQN